jgi:hypothetical protein
LVGSQQTVLVLPPGPFVVWGLKTAIISDRLSNMDLENPMNHIEPAIVVTVTLKGPHRHKNAEFIEELADQLHAGRFTEEVDISPEGGF